MNKNIEQMKNGFLVLVIAATIAFSGCQKKELLVEEESKFLKNEERDLKFDLGIKKKILVTELHSSRTSLGARYSHTSLVFDNKMWVIGHDLSGPDGVWYSSNGSDWHMATDSPMFFVRSGHTLVSFDGKMWVIAGSAVNNGELGFSNDVWYSKNGIHWSEAELTDQFSERTHHTSVVFGNKIWVINGRGSSNKKIKGYTSKNNTSYFALSDVWSLKDPDCCPIDDITLKTN